MQSMKTSFERKIEELNALLSKSSEEFKKKMREKENEVEELKRVNKLLNNRFQELEAT